MNQMGDRFDMVGLGEEVEGGEPVEGIAVGDEVTEVAGQRRGVAGDVGDPGGRQRGERSQGVAFQTGARWVDQGEGNWARLGGALG